MTERCQVFPESLRIVDDVCKDIPLIRVRRKVFNLVFEIFKPWLVLDAELLGADVADSADIISDSLVASLHVCRMIPRNIIRFQ